MESSPAQVTTQSSSAQVTMQSPQNGKRAPAWTAWEVLDLIAICGEDSVLTELRSKRRNEKTFEKISKAMMEKGHTRDSVQCRVKVKELRQAYQKTKEANVRSKAGPKTCCFYAELHAILEGSAISSPPLSVDSKVGVVISAMAEDSADGEDEEEEEEDELAESTQHSVLPNSQGLFLTQMELPSQPSQASSPDNEAMEATSAANFSSLPTPSQRLSQIRRREKKDARRNVLGNHGSNPQ
ncbi:myb/SANT-like DNA-binding domain-containing protein 2 [Gopherus flavomarginatus]|uniref:myb/SANT-like DNA-binding domain-containing protein 2 n=1 Tax=Gopherus flavomarginatus TaxID=286002 RepID=UPI0021CBCA9A|nr:myb/SANT-like DNA-binding domain-containing protein 2 [Gopherus flavomarginatus]